MKPERPYISGKAGPLFLSRSILMAGTLTVWSVSFVTSANSLDGSDRDLMRLGAQAFDLLGFTLAMFASDPKTRASYLPWLRLGWLGSSVASGFATASTVTVDSGYDALAFNVLMGTALVFLLSMRWDLMGFLFLVGVNAVLSGVYYATTPRFGSGEGLFIFFITLIPGLLGALAVVGIQSRLEQAVSRQGTALPSPEERPADVHLPAPSDMLAQTRHQIQELFAKVARNQHHPLDPTVAEEAQALASQLRGQLMLLQSSTWLVAALGLAKMESTVAVAAQPDLAERIPQAQRSAVLAVTMLLATPVGGPERGSADAGGALQVFLEPDLDDRILITWRVRNLNPSRCTPALWSELETLGVPRVQTDPSGASIMVHVKAPRQW
ncbi:hypothetical protein [Paenarthrobacter nitroguajacolicus]|uniref:hypothetical protein n=1 Tax=Paenarthrobacter nitroguajacolicus TaxID=211146 RepID=UPI002857E054|nr:hypothetical protein [Paenarthrobacter nitroguajacolicus]MDR6637294.1 hypothetical protein [Paenarthrobacter nitroguajacolicus]